MHNSPKISVITPSYNQGNYIEQTILSVLNQNYPNLEYIIIDGGSNDNTIDIIKKYEAQLKYWVSEADKGQSDAINKGFKVATGDIINWLNSDDYFAPGALHKISNFFLNNTYINALTTTVHNFEERGTEWDELTKICSNNVEYITRTFNNQPGTFFRKVIWDKYFPLPQQLSYTMDQYLWFCFWLEHTVTDFATKNFATVYFRRHALSKTSNSLKDIIFKSLGKTFFNEQNLIFWSYFIGKDKPKAKIIADYFWDDFNYQTNCITFPLHLETDKNTTENIFQLYLFELLKEDYKHGFFNRFNRNIRYMLGEYLSKDDRSLLKDMKSKSANQMVIKFYRSIYWKTKAILSK